MAIIHADPMSKSRSKLSNNSFFLTLSILSRTAFSQKSKGAISPLGILSYIRNITVIPSLEYSITSDDEAIRSKVLISVPKSCTKSDRGIQ